MDHTTFLLPITTCYLCCHQGRMGGGCPLNHVYLWVVHILGSFTPPPPQVAVKEMEAAAIAWVCSLYAKPLICVKAITDIVDGGRCVQEAA